MKYKPLTDGVLVLRDTVEEKMEGRIIIPSHVQEPPLTGKVVAAGPDTSLKVGERVLYVKYGGSPVELDGQPYILLREAEVLLTVGK